MSDRAALGTLAWAEQTNGLLSTRDRVTLLAQAFLYGVTTLPAELRRALGIRRRRLANVDLAELNPPDSSVARSAEALVAGMVPSVVANHSYRTYVWGAFLAAHDGVTYDPEVVYVASLLHDLCFADPQTESGPHCFTLPAARKADQMLRDEGWDKKRRDLAAEAITLHLNLWPPRQSPEARVVFLGARLDIAGYRYEEIDSGGAAAVLEKYPRLDMKRDSAPMFDSQATANPGTRVHFFTRYLGVKWFMQRARFLE